MWRTRSLPEAFRRRRALWALLLLALLVPHSGPGPPQILLENEHLRIALDARNGRVLQVHNKDRSLDLLELPGGGRPPWRIQLQGQADWVQGHTRFSWRWDPGFARGQAVELAWTAPQRLTVLARVELPEGDPNAYFRVRVESPGGAAVDKVTYPILAGITDLGSYRSELAHPQGTGFLFHDPFRLFQVGPGGRKGLRYSPYPEGFAGSTMQFMAYYIPGRGGFYLATHDPHKGVKWLNFYNSAGERGFAAFDPRRAALFLGLYRQALEASFIHQSPDVHPGNGLVVPYPVVVGALTEGSWYEAADRYKAWALDQPWTARGPLYESRRSRWLVEEVGFATFGVNARFDRAPWLDRFAGISEQPTFHILGANWPGGGADYRNNLPGGLETWFPAQFSQANLETIRRNGDFWAPFEFNLLLSADRDENPELARALISFPDQPFSLNAYALPFVDPLSEPVRELHVTRDRELVRLHDADALYYDISVNNVLMILRDEGHGHPVGGGGWVVDAYTSLLRESKQAASQAARGRYVPQGAELVSELMIPFLDFYQARAEASPVSIFEGDYFRDWIKRGLVEKIPLFTYVYHEYGPLRLDGWGKLSPEVGDLFYWVASRVALWGGLFELNYEFSPLEAIQGRLDIPREHYYPFEPREFAIDQAKVAFVRELARARTGFARDFLVYGTMRRPLVFAVPTIDLDYLLYNAPINLAHYGERGRMRVPVVVHAAWESPQGALGFVFLNLRPQHRQPVRLTLDPAAYGLDPEVPFALEVANYQGRWTVGEYRGRTELTLRLPPRRVMLLVARPLGPSAH